MSIWSIDDIYGLRAFLFGTGKAVTDADSPADVNPEVFFYEADPSGGNIILNLPPLVTGKPVFVIKLHPLNTVQIVAQFGELISGLPNVLMTQYFEWFFLWPGATRWFILGHGIETYPGLHHTTHEAGGSDEISLAGLPGIFAADGIATLSSGVATVADSGVTANSRFMFTAQDINVVGNLRADNKVVGVSFDINSTGLFDDGVVYWQRYES